MAAFTIYHNPKCVTSNKTLGILRKKKGDIKVIEYLKTPPSISTLKGILKAGKLRAEEIVRRKEPLYKENQSKWKNLNDAGWLKLLAKNPRLIERPIVVKGNRAVLARPPEKVKELF